jgi:Tryptophan synthase beta chain
MTEKVDNRFGMYGGQFVPEALMPELIRLQDAFEACKHDDAFQREFHRLLNDYAGRPSLLYYAKNMTEDLGGAKIYLKREDLNHTGAHKINNVIGQALLASAWARPG